MGHPTDKDCMKKLIFCLSIVFVSQAFAQGSFEEAFRQLSKINDKSLAPDAVCNTCEASGTSSAIGPQAVVEKIFDGNLTFLGRDLFPGSDQNRTCVFKSQTAYVLYHNCMASKKEAAATDIDIIDFNGGITHFYIENSHTNPISQMTRSGYDSTWTVDYIRTQPPGNLNVASLKSFMEQHSTMNNKSGACFIGGSFKAKDPSQRTQCFGPIKDTPAAKEWGESADTFWQEPGSRWYEALRHLRKSVTAAKF